MTGLPSTMLLAATATAVVALLGLGVARAARKAGFPGWLGPGVAAGMTLWLAATAALARSGVLADRAAVPPRWPLLPLTALGALTLLGRTPTARRILEGVPPWQPVALQAFRVGVEVAFWRLHAEGVAPVQVTFEGRNFDGLVGLTAPAVAAGIAAGWVGPRTAIAWNLSGLVLLLNAIGTVATSVPGPLRLAWAGEPFAAITTWPVIWIPALLAPLGISLHILSIRQALAGPVARRTMSTGPGLHPDGVD